ncbi:hypothetical protein Pelo_15001 [Pelomyxa schiedti]|nr:hypothetical protein Pelo_15001 [Pelomyxa schiedti]
MDALRFLDDDAGDEGVEYVRASWYNQNDVPPSAINRVMGGGGGGGGRAGQPHARDNGTDTETEEEPTEDDDKGAGNDTAPSNSANQGGGALEIQRKNSNPTDPPLPKRPRIIDTGTGMISPVTSATYVTYSSPSNNESENDAEKWYTSDRKNGRIPKSGARGSGKSRKKSALTLTEYEGWGEEWEAESVSDSDDEEYTEAAPRHPRKASKQSPANEEDPWLKLPPVMSTSDARKLSKRKNKAKHHKGAKTKKSVRGSTGKKNSSSSRAAKVKSSTPTLPKNSPQPPLIAVLNVELENPVPNKESPLEKNQQEDITPVWMNQIFHRDWSFASQVTNTTLNQTLRWLVPIPGVKPPEILKRASPSPSPSPATHPPTPTDSKPTNYKARRLVLPPTVPCRFSWDDEVDFEDQLAIPKPPCISTFMEEYKLQFKAQGRIITERM